jgi:hypothetical protein
LQPKKRLVFLPAIFRQTSIFLLTIPASNLGVEHTIFPKLIISTICHNLTDTSLIFAHNTIMARAMHTNVAPALTANCLAMMPFRVFSNQGSLVGHFPRSNCFFQLPSYHRL